PRYTSLGRASHVLRSSHRGVENLRIIGTAAQIARERVRHLIARRSGVVLKVADHRHDEARRAERALETGFVEDGLLHRMELLAIGEPLDRGDLAAAYLVGEHRAGVVRRAVDEDGTCAAVGPVAT